MAAIHCCEKQGRPHRAWTIVIIVPPTGYYRAVSSLFLAMNTLPALVGWWIEGELGVGGGGETRVGARIYERNIACSEHKPYVWLPGASRQFQ